jgi:hypothetical protein
VLALIDFFGRVFMKPKSLTDEQTQIVQATPIRLFEIIKSCEMIILLIAVVITMGCMSALEPTLSVHLEIFKS